MSRGTPPGTPVRSTAPAQRAGPALMAAWLLVAAFAAGCRAPGRPDQVVLVTVDTLRADRLGSYGYPRPTSPFLDSFAAEGVVFERTSSSSSHTAPSHASLFTSLEPQQHGVLRNGERLGPQARTLAGAFREAGYRTGAFADAGFLEGVAVGFEVFERSAAPAAGQTLAAARRWLAEPDPRPSFAWVHLFDVHEWTVDERLDTEAVEALRRRDVLSPRRLAELAEHQGLRPPWRLRRSHREVLDRYDGQVLAVDRALAEFFDAPELTRSDEPLWIVTSDHGEGLGNHGEMGHGRHVYEEQLRVPLLLRTRRLPAGTRVASTARLVDLLPTVAELASLPTGGSEAWAGRSLVPLALGAAPVRRSAWAERRPADAKRLRAGWQRGDVFSFRRGPYKIIVRSQGEDELYDLVADPHEHHDLAPHRPVLLEELRRALDSHLGGLRGDGPEAGPDGIDEKHRAELEALGYL